VDAAPFPQSTSERVYLRLLRLYPAHFRQRYGSAMAQLFADQLRDARSAGWRGSVGLTWLRTVTDLVATAIVEHTRRETTVAQSAEIHRPTPVTRMLGLLGVVGGALLLAAFVSWNPFADLAANTIRLFLFTLGGVAIALALYRRQAAVAPRLALVVTAAVVLTCIWNTVHLVVALGQEHPFGGTIGFIYFLAMLSLWLTAAAFGAAVLRTGAAARGLPAWLATAVRIGALALAIGSLLAILGMDRLELIRSESFGAQVQSIAGFGIFLNGVGWILLGLGVLLGGSRRATPA
jgi:hypothetical protein